MSEGVVRQLQAQVALLEKANQELRMALAEQTARVAPSGEAFLLADGTYPGSDALTCRLPAVPGRVTVVVPAFNAWPYLERAIRSVWQQTLSPERIELLVVDDGSSDGTSALAERLAVSSPVAMRVLRHEGSRNRGVAPSRQLAVSHASGEFVAMLDADDAYLPARLECSLDAFSDRPGVLAVCSLGRNVDAAGDVIRGHNGTERAGEWRIFADLKPPFTFDHLWRVDPIANSSLTIRRSALERVGGFPSLMGHQSEDWLLVLKLSLLAPIPCIDHELIDYTHHPGAYTSAYHAQGLREGARLEMFYHLAWWMLRSREHQEAGVAFFRREYPRLVAEHQRLLPFIRECYAAGLRPETASTTFADHVQRLAAELESLRSVVHSKLHENKRLRSLVRSALTTPSLQ